MYQNVTFFLIRYLRDQAEVSEDAVGPIFAGVVGTATTHALPISPETIFKIYSAHSHLRLVAYRVILRLYQWLPKK